MKKLSPAQSYEFAVHQTLELDSMKPKEIREKRFKERLQKLKSQEKQESSLGLAKRDSANRLHVGSLDNVQKLKGESVGDEK